MKALIQVRPEVFPTPIGAIPALHFQYKEEDSEGYDKLVMEVGKDVFLKMTNALDNGVATLRKSFYPDSTTQYVVIDDLPILEALKERNGGAILEAIRVTAEMLGGDDIESH